MSKLMEEIYEIDRKYQSEMMAYKMISLRNIPLEDISYCTGLTLDELKDIEKEWQLDKAAAERNETNVKAV